MTRLRPRIAIAKHKLIIYVIYIDKNVRRIATKMTDTVSGIAKILETADKFFGRFRIRGEGQARSEVKIEEAKAEAVAMLIKGEAKRQDELHQIVHQERVSQLQAAFEQGDYEQA